MTIKSLLLGSAAALAAVSGVQAADAIVAAEPEPMEYVRVCDAFGSGFFYIPGGETCLKIGGYVRFETGFGQNKSGRSDWDSFSRAQFNLDARSDTELGTLRGFAEFRANGDTGMGGANAASSANLGSGAFVLQSFIELGGLRVGKFYSWWDDSLSGEYDTLSSNALFNSVRYTFGTDALSFGVSVDELEGLTKLGTELDNNLGVAANLGFELGGIEGALLGGYDTDNENGAVRGIFTAELGPGKLGLAGVWASGVNAYYAESEWAVAVEYNVKVADKLTLIPGFQYFSKAESSAANGDFTGGDKWIAGVAAKYDITKGLSALVAVNYEDRSDYKDFQVHDDEIKGFFRLNRSF